MVTLFEELWKMVLGLAHCFEIIICTIMLLSITLYIAACAAVELISKDKFLQSHPETEAIMDENFSSLDKVLLTYFQFITMDDLASIYVPLVQQRWYLFLYFASVVILVSVAVMNLVTALLVDKSISKSRADKELLRQKARCLRPEIQKAFQSVDINGDKVITFDEIMACVDELPEVLKKMAKLGGIDELFEMLDTDGQGEILDEFTDGVFHLMFSDVKLETLQELKLLRQLKKKSDDIFGALMKINIHCSGQLKAFNPEGSLSVSKTPIAFVEVEREIVS